MVADTHHFTVMRITLFNLIRIRLVPIVCVRGTPRLHFEPLELMNFDCNSDPDTAFHSRADSDLTSHADPDPLP